MFRNPNLRNVGDVLRRNAQNYADREGLVDIEGGVRLSWGEINHRCNRLAQGLVNLGVQKGDRVAVLLLNCYQWLEIIFAVQKIGAILVAVNTRLAPEEIAALLNDSSANTLIYGEEYSSIISSLGQKCPSLKYRIGLGRKAEGNPDYDTLMADQLDEEPQVEVGLEDVAMIAYTGGTTGLPKGGIILHRTILDTIQDIPIPFAVAFQSKVSLSGPISLSTVIYSIFNYVYCATTIILTKFDILKLMETIEKEKVEILSQASVPVIMMANHPEVKKFDLSSLKLLRYGGSPLSLEQLKQIKKIFKCELNQGYGSTETFSQISLLMGYDHEIGEDPEKIQRLRSVGRPFAGNKVRLIDDEGKDVPPGEIGEVAVRSSHVLVGYWNRPEENEKAFKDGWFHTNDLAYRDEEGYLFIVDRKNDMIKSGGFSVYPAEVEKVLVDHPGIAEVAVVSAPDDKWGERVVAVVVLKAGVNLTEEEVIDFCRGKIGGYKIPKQVSFRKESLPRTAMEKVKRKELREIYWKGQGSNGS